MVTEIEELLDEMSGELESICEYDSELEDTTLHVRKSAAVYVCGQHVKWSVMLLSFGSACAVTFTF